MAIHTFGPNAVDWEERVDLARLRDERLARLRAQLERHYELVERGREGRRGDRPGVVGVIGGRVTDRTGEEQQLAGFDRKTDDR